MRLSIAIFIVVCLCLASMIRCHGQNNAARPNIPLSIGNTNTLNNGLVFYYKMDEVSGDRADSGPNALTLTDNNTVPSAAGIITNAASFDSAAAEYLSHADDSLYSPGTSTSFTFALWVYPTNNNSSKKFLGKTATGQYEYYIRDDGSNDARFGISTNGTTIDAATAWVKSTAGTLTLNAWNFVVAWYDTSAGSIHIQVNDGVAANSTLTTNLGPPNGTASFKVGTFDDYGAFNMRGRIDEVGMWLRTLTAGERTYLYNSGSARTCCPFP